MSFGKEIKLGDALNKMLKQLNLEDQAQQHRIEEVWKSIMKEPIQKHIKGLWFKDGTLTVQVSSAPLRQELFMNRYKLQLRLNEELGSDLITQILLK